MVYEMQEGTFYAEKNDTKYKQIKLEHYHSKKKVKKIGGLFY